MALEAQGWMLGCASTLMLATAGSFPFATPTADGYCAEGSTSVFGSL